MSFRLSASAGDALQSFSRSGARTPLRSLQNEILPATESSTAKSKPLISSEPVKHTRVIVALEDALKNASANGTDGTKAQSSQEQTSYNTEEPDTERTTSNSPNNITLKSYECDGGEVEISGELVKKAEDSFVLPPPGLSEYTQYIQTLDSSCISDVTEDFNFEEQKLDHLYCKREDGAPSVISTGDILQDDKATDAITDITLKFLNCTGGEIEIADPECLYDQTIPLPAEQSGSDAESYSDGKDSAIFTEEVDHTEHPYCNKRALESFHVTNESSDREILHEKDQKKDNYKDDSVINRKLVDESCNISVKGASFVSEEQFCQEQLATNSLSKQTENDLEENGSLQVIKNEIVDASLTEDAPPLFKTSQSENHQQTTQEKSYPYYNEGAVDSFHVTNDSSVCEILSEKAQTEKKDDDKDDSINPKLDDESCNTSIKGASFVSEELFCQEQLATNNLSKQTENDLEENGSLQVMKNETVDASLPDDASLLFNTSRSENHQQTTQDKSHPCCNEGEMASFHVTNESNVREVLNENDQTEKEDDDKDDSTINPKLDDESYNTSMKEQSCQLATNSVLKQTEHKLEENGSLQVIKNEIVDASLTEDAPPLFKTCQSENHQQTTQEKSHLELSSMGLSRHSAHHEAISAPSDPNPDVEERNRSESESEVHSSVRPSQGSDTADSALGLSSNAPAPVVATEPTQAETLPDVFKAMSECTPLQLKFLTPIVRRASLACKQAQKELGIDQDDLNPAELWREQLDSPLPRPLFNSTELVQRSQACVVMEANGDVSPVKPVVAKAVTEVPVIPEGPLQQQLRQMAEFLMLASGKMGPVHVPTPAPPPPKAEHHSVSVGTTPMKMVNHSINTSGQFERKRNVSVEDQGTLTDPLLWNVPVGSLESVPRPELEQRLLSSMIIVEALVQQLGAARAQTLPPAGTAPSLLRERAAQTEHTELTQTSMHRDLYLEALNRIQELEMDASSLQSLTEYMQNVKTNMTVLTHDTEAALRQMKQLGNVVTEDHDNLVSNYARMKSLVGRSKETQVRMIQKVKDAFQDREDMRTQMEEAFSAKDAAYAVMDQLRKHCSAEIAELEKCVGSQQELLCALRKAHPEQVALNKAYSETLDSASELLSKTTEEQSSLANELRAVRGLLQKCSPILLRLNEKTDAALRERDERIAERDQAVQDKLQTEEELNQTLQNLQTAKEQISDLNLQVTILTSEMGVLRQKLSESDEERAQLDRKATELSATVSSTLASYTFLEQALASETTKLQQSWADIKQAKERAQELELSLDQSKRCVSELSAALAHSEEQVYHLSSVSEAQALQLQQLQEMCAQLRGVREENEFLQMENELSREQMAESERMLRENLKSLRERNIQCEDLNTELCQLQHANRNLQEELESVRTKLSAGKTEHKEKLEQIVTEIAILHHTVRNLTNELHDSVKEELSDRLSPHNTSPSSFVDSVASAPTPDKEESPEPAFSDSDAASDLLFSESSAFTRVTAVTPKRGRSSDGGVEEQSSVSELLVGLDSTVTELKNIMSSVQQRKDAELKEKQETICRLQRELEAANSAHQTEVSELQFELNRLKARMEKANATLQQRAQDEKTVSKLVAEISEIQEMHNKHKADSIELRKELVELRRSLQQSKSEVQFLRDELKKHGAQTAPDFMDEKIGLLKELEKLRMSLQAEEQARNKLLERAKRHQGIYLTNQQKSEKELQMLNNMINKVRETLLSLPASVRKCEQLQQLIEYVG